MDTISSVILRSAPRKAFLAGVLVLAVGLAGCGEDVEPRTMEDILSEVEGTRLSAAETASLVETADLMCGMKGSVLAKTLTEVDPERLNYLDWVFSDRCPERNGVYAEVLEKSFPEHVQDSDS